MMYECGEVFLVCVCVCVCVCVYVCVSVCVSYLNNLFKTFLYSPTCSFTSTFHSLPLLNLRGVVLFSLFLCLWHEYFGLIQIYTHVLLWRALVLRAARSSTLRDRAGQGWWFTNVYTSAVPNFFYKWYCLYCSARFVVFLCPYKTIWWLDSIFEAQVSIYLLVCVSVCMIHVCVYVWL